MNGKFIILKIVRLKMPVACCACNKEMATGSVAWLEKGNLSCIRCNIILFQTDTAFKWESAKEQARDSWKEDSHGLV
jgi:hypothetical protein